MLFSQVRSAVLACSVTALLLAVPAESRACGWLDGLCGWGAARTTYRAPFVAPSCAPVCAPRTCSYVPQTCYRTVYRRVPVTTCRPFTSCDPCTGCPVTAFRPVTTFASRPVLVPYTTYRVVYSQACSPCAPRGPRAPYGPCVGGACGPAPLSGTSSCPSCAPTAGPATNGAVPAPSAGQPGSPLTPGPQTFLENGQPELRKTLKPIPETDTKLNSTPAPNLIDPNSRTTLRPIQSAPRYHFAATTVERLPSTANDTGWRPARD